MPINNALIFNYIVNFKLKEDVLEPLENIYGY